MKLDSTAELGNGFAYANTKAYVGGEIAYAYFMKIMMHVDVRVQRLHTRQRISNGDEHDTVHVFHTCM
jgi:hypothetical protein